jgi:hypothetical protein
VRQEEQLVMAMDARRQQFIEWTQKATDAELQEQANLSKAAMEIAADEFMLCQRELNVRTTMTILGRRTAMVR